MIPLKCSDMFHNTVDAPKGTKYFLISNNSYFFKEINV